MKYLYSIFSALILLACTSGNNSGRSEGFSNHDIAVKVSGDWNITEKEDYKTAFYMAMEKSGINATGLVTLNYTSENFTPEEWINSNIENLETAFKERKAEIRFDPVTQTQFKGIPCHYCRFIVTLSGVDSEGKIYAFMKNGKTFSYLEQGAVNDYEENKPGFEFIRNSLAIK